MTHPGLHEDKRQFEKFLRARQGEFNVESAEEKFQNREANSKTATDIPKIIANPSPESKPAVGITKNMRNSLLGKDEDKPEKPASTTKLSRAELLKEPASGRVLIFYLHLTTFSNIRLDYV